MRNSRKTTRYEGSLSARNPRPTFPRIADEEAAPVLVVSSVCTSYEAGAQVANGVVYQLPTTEPRVVLE